MGRQRKRVKAYQAERDQAAETIRRIVLSGERSDAAYFVFLRPFDIDGKFYAAPSGIPADKAYVEEYGWPSASHDLESALANLVYSHGLLIAVSDEAGDAGAGHVMASADSWHQEVRALCAQAAAIFVVPFDYPGTAWEVEMLIEAGWLEKTFFVMPADQGFVRRLGIKWLTRDYRRLWAAGRARYPILALPEFQIQGGIFQMLAGESRGYLFSTSNVSWREEPRARDEIRALIARLGDLANAQAAAPEILRQDQRGEGNGHQR